MTPERPKLETVGFGFEPEGGAYHFVVTIPRGADGVVLVEEHFAYGESVEEAAKRARFSDAQVGFEVRPPNPKVELALFKWQMVAEEVRVEFNRRLRGKGQKPGAWKSAENRLSPYLGKELILLLWSIEEANPADVRQALANWQGLAPEERWWLYATINAATGHASEGRGRGWRRAIQIAFTENPVTESLTGSSYYSRRSDSSVRNGKRGRTGSAADKPAQPSLPDLDEESTPAETPGAPALPLSEIEEKKPAL